MPEMIKISSLTKDYGEGHGIFNFNFSTIMHLCFCSTLTKVGVQYLYILPLQESFCGNSLALRERAR